ncbi:hypothetical protein lerEdw1_009654 [Lerista edwardsae]|nr:hypothetical protein lerEdw1_009654 [Lerista edwardsae]
MTTAMAGGMEEYSGSHRILTQPLLLYLQNRGSFDNNVAGSGSFNDNGNAFAVNSNSFNKNNVGHNNFNDNVNSFAVNGGSFDDNTAGDDSFNNNGNSFAVNGGSFDGNNVGSNSFNDNGNSFAVNGGSFDGNNVGSNSFNDNGNTYDNPVIWVSMNHRPLEPASVSYRGWYNGGCVVSWNKPPAALELLRSCSVAW